MKVVLFTLLIGACLAETCKVCMEYGVTSDNDELQKLMEQSMSVVEGQVACKNANETTCPEGQTCDSLKLSVEMSMTGVDDSVKITTKTALCGIGTEGFCDAAEKDLESELQTDGVTFSNMKCESQYSWSLIG
eukprot:sb/3474871/